MLVDTIGDSFLFCSITPCLSIMCSRSLCAPFYYKIQLMDGWISIAMNVSCLQSCFYCVNQLSPFVVYVHVVNLLRLTFKTPKKSSLLSPPLCSSNVRVCFHTMRPVSTCQKHIFEIFAFHTFQTPAFSSPAFSAPPFKQ